MQRRGHALLIRLRLSRLALPLKGNAQYKLPQRRLLFKFANLWRKPHEEPLMRRASAGSRAGGCQDFCVQGVWMLAEV